MIRLMVAILMLLSGISFLPAADPKPYPYPDHIHLMMGVGVHWEMERDGGKLIPPSVYFSTMGQAEGNRVRGQTVHLNDPKTPLYINGIKYDHENSIKFPQDPHMSEIGRWYHAAGYFKATKREGGGWNFDSIDGKEEKALRDYSMQWVQDSQQKARYEAAWKELGHSGIMKTRVKTIPELRELWKKEITGEHKWTGNANGVYSYTVVPEGKRIPLLPYKFDPRSLPIIPSAI